ncbi:MAG: polysaccharide deacetylase family protein [Gaiellaceae bacterium]
MTNPRLVSAGPRDRRQVALSFDDGPSGSTPEVLEILGSYGARATFFVIGEWVERKSDVVREAAVRGHEIANHTWTHADADRIRELGTLRDEVARTTTEIEKAVGRPPRLLRPPYGSDPGRYARVAADCGLAATVLWSVQTFDWQDPDDASSIVSQVEAEAEPGAIVLFHDGQRETNDAQPRAGTLAALPTVLEGLRADGYEFATVSELLRT